MVPATIWSTTDDKASIGFFTVTDLFADPCDPDSAPAGVGPTADDLVGALADNPAVSIGAQADVTVAGYSGTRLDFSGSEPECDEGVDAVLMRSHPGNFAGYPAGGGKLNRWFVLDVEGRRLLIQAIVPDSLPDSVTAEVESILQSIVIEAP